MTSPTVFLHCGDYDPSGESIFSAQGNDAREFVQQVAWSCSEGSEHAGGLCEAMGLDAEESDRLEAARVDLLPVRVALTEAQVVEHGLPTAPPKKSDTRSRNWRGETCQLEAMPPELLASTVRGAIRDQLALGRYEDEVALEAADRETIARGIERAEAE